MLDFGEHLLNDSVLTRHQPALVEFWAPWCVYSLLVKRKTEAMSERFGSQLLIGRLNIEEHMALVKSLGIEFVPALGFFHGGRLVEKWYGDLPLRAITDVIARYEPVSR
jgi:thioredoxin-like negative regulator of GroEL